MDVDARRRAEETEPCPNTWGRKGVGTLHRCYYAKGHIGKCLCLCGRGKHKVRPL